VRPSGLARTFDAASLSGHFLVSRTPPVEPAGWNRSTLAGWTLLHDHALPVQPIRDGRDGSEVGWLVGHALDLDRGLICAGGITMPPGRSPEEWLHDFGGRFAAIFIQPKAVIYPDAAATLPVLFDPSLRCAASSPFLLISPGEEFPESRLVDSLAIRTTGTWFTVAATPHDRADLLLANHVLDLSAWEQRRVWPRERPRTEDPGALAETVATVLERTLAASAATGRPNVGFTAGGDSRSLLAVARPFADRFRFFTVAHPDHLGQTDLRTAPSLAETLGLDYRLIPLHPASATDVDRFMYLTGCLIGELRGRKATRAYDELGGGEIYVSGVGAEMARGIGWRRGDRPGLHLEPGDLLSRFLLPQDPELVRRAGGWLSRLPPGIDALDALTLFHVEMRVGGWGGPLTFAYPNAYTFTLYPYAHRRIVEAVLQLPWEHRRSGDLRRDIIASRWPGLLQVPVNRRPARVVVSHSARRAGRLTRRILGRLTRSPRGS